MKPNVILDRLVFRKHYGLAIHIAKHLKLPESRILEHWAFHKVIHDKSEHIGKYLFPHLFNWIYYFTDNKDVAKKIALKFGNPEVEGISFCNIAKKAEEVGKRELAIMVIINSLIALFHYYNIIFIAAPRIGTKIKFTSSSFAKIRRE